MQEPILKTQAEGGRELATAHRTACITGEIRLMSYDGVITGLSENIINCHILYTCMLDQKKKTQMCSLPFQHTKLHSKIIKPLVYATKLYKYYQHPLFGSSVPAQRKVTSKNRTHSIAKCSKQYPTILNNFGDLLVDIHSSEIIN